MRALRDLLADATDERFRTAVLLGIASIPVTIGVNWLLAPDPVSATALFVACVFSGYLYGTRREAPAYAGILTGIVGGIPIIGGGVGMVIAEIWGYPPVADIVGNSIGMAAVSSLMALLTALGVSAVLIVIGALGGLIGGWISGRIDSSRPTPSRS